MQSNGSTAGFVIVIESSDDTACNAGTLAILLLL